eukprot:1208137-Pleurochrysis_carterae.AAC.1
MRHHRQPSGLRWRRRTQPAAQLGVSEALTALRRRRICRCGSFAPLFYLLCVPSLPLGHLWETPVRCTATAVALQTCCASARCVLRGFVSETE